MTSLEGRWVSLRNYGGEDDHDRENGSWTAPNSGAATGSFAFQGSGSSGGWRNLTIASGTFTINGTTYTVTSGSVSMNHGGESGSGTGTTGNGATFEIHVTGLHGNRVGNIRLDVTAGKGEYLVHLGPLVGVREDSD